MCFLSYCHIYINANIDSLQFRKLVREQADRLIDDSDSNELAKVSDERLKALMSMDPFEKEFLKRAVLNYSAKNPIHRRVPKNVISTFYRIYKLINIPL